MQNDWAMLKLGEGWTPLHHARRLGEAIGCTNTYIKDEGLNVTASFKARGLALAVSRALELGAKELAIPSAGNAACAMSAYAAAAGLPAHVYMPADVPSLFQVECRELGANVNLVDGLINDCGVKVREGVAQYGWFDVSTLASPTASRAKRRWVTKSPNKWAGRSQTSSSIRPAAVQGWLACGRRLTKWNAWG